jgi:ABC-type transport system substrate-binding protein
VAASGTRVTPITVWGWTDDPTLSPSLVRYTAQLLRRLGYPARVHLVTHASLAHPPPRVFKKIQLIPAGWGDTPYGFFATWFSCEGGTSHGSFGDHRIDRQNLRAQSLSATRPRAAAALWARIDREIVDQAAWVPFVNERGIGFVSARARNYEVHPYWASSPCGVH